MVDHEDTYPSQSKPGAGPAGYLTFVDTNECVDASQRGQLPPRRCDSIKVTIYSVKT